MRKKSSSYGLEQAASLHALLAALSDDLALPLLQIKTSLEAMEYKDFSRSATRASAEKISLSAQNGLQLIEAYRLVLRSSSHNELPLEPVAIGAVLQDIAHSLSPYAKKYDTVLEVDVQNKLTPVLAHPPSLTAALQVLSSSLIRAQAAQAKQKNNRLLLGAHRTAENVISTGVFSNVNGLSDRTLRIARTLMGKARQPLPHVPVGAASGVLIADMLCTAMWEPLRAAAHRNMKGLATAVPISKQLQFV